MGWFSRSAPQQAAPPPPTDELATITYDLALRALAEQEAALDNLRTRAGSLLTVVSIVVSFLGGRALDAAGLDRWTVLGLIVFAIAVATCIWVLWPRSLTFALNGPRTYEALYGTEIGEARRTLTYWVQGYRAANQPTIEHLGRVWGFGAIAVVVDVILWGLALAT